MQQKKMVQDPETGHFYETIEQKATTISLAGTTTINPNKLYLIDFSKLNSVNDLVLILAAMSIAFPGDHPHIEALKPFLNMDNAMDIPGRETKPQTKEFNLPKLKQVK